jgi:plasmid stability protein
MKNVTVTLEEEVARWVRIRAAEESQSVSRFLGDMLRRQMVEEKRYEEAMDRFLSRKPSRISDSGVYPSREELYDRPGLR